MMGRRRAEAKMEEEGEGLTDSSSATAGEDDEGEDEDDAQAACDDIGDVGERAVMADTVNGTFWVDTDGSRGGICRVAGEDGRVVV